MIRTAHLCTAQASLIAVSALDELVSRLVLASPGKLPAHFLDWIVDEATPLVEERIDSFFTHPAFAATLRQGDHRVALSRWVHHWVCPQIARRFQALAQHLPAFFPAPAELAPLHQHVLAVPAQAVRQPPRPARVSAHPVAAAVQAAF